MSILAVYREPFDLTPRVARLPDGLSLSQLSLRMHGLPSDFNARGVICINGHPVPRATWPLVRPKATAHGVPVEVTFHAPPMGGDDGGGKQLFALVASIALTALTGGILAGNFATNGGWFAAKSLSAALLAAGTTLVGSLLISALSAPPVEQQRARERPNEGAASATGNVLDPNGAIPRVIGERKVFPPLACEPLTYFDGTDEVVEAVYCLAGPHRLNDLRIGEASIADMGVEYETREGWPGDDALTMATRQGRSDSIQVELRGHAVDADDGGLLDVSTGDIAASLPQPYIAATRDAPDEQWLHIAFAQGLHLNGSTSDLLRVPIRLRIRRRGDLTWINFPELHFQAANLRQMRASIKLIWRTDTSGAPSAAASEGFVEARRFSPGQTAAPAGSDWVANSYFGTTGDAWMTATNLGTTGLGKTLCDRYNAVFLLDPTVFPRGRYEIELLRGATVRSALYASASYTVSSAVWDLFGYQGVVPAIVQDRSGIADSLYLLRSVSVWNEPPVQTDELALIAVRARNRSLEGVSCLAGGYVRDWDGTDWRTWVVSVNPAPHVRDIYVGSLSAKPVPLEMIDNDELLTWRSNCTARGLTVNHLTEDQSVMDAASVVASCGYARPRMSDQWGVVRDYDRSAEGLVQIFTPRNSRGFSWTRAFPDMPDGFRVNFRDVTRDYEQRQISVVRPGHIGALRISEQVSYEGIVTEADVTARAIYDLRQAEYRGTFYNIDVPAEALVCRRGDLVGVNHDTLTEWMGEARVADFNFNGAGLVTTIKLDAAVPVLNEADMHAVTNMHGVTNMHLVGSKSGVILRGPAGPQAVRLLSNASGTTDLLQLTVPMIAADVREDDLVAVGVAGSETLRLIVFGIEPRDNLEASITLVDEGKELFV